MPPRKGDSSEATTDESSEDGVNIDDLNLPKSIITRLAEEVLPPGTQIQGNAVLAFTKSATVFTNYISTHASEHTRNANRNTITPADVFQALEDLGFDFKVRLEAELASGSLGIGIASPRRKVIEASEDRRD